MFIFAQNSTMTAAKDLSSEYTLLYGIAEKSVFEMSDAERKQAAAKAFERAKEAAFTRGLPIIYGLNGLVIAEYADGRRFVRENGKDVRLYNGN